MKDRDLRKYLEQPMKSDHEALEEERHQSAKLCDEIGRLKAQLEQAQANCAAMRQACVGMVAWYETPESDQPEKLPIRIRACEKALSTDCGKGYIATEKVKPLVVALREVISPTKHPSEVADQCYQALETARSLGLLSGTQK